MKTYFSQVFMTDIELWVLLT